MPLSVTDFRARFSEFDKAPEPRVEYALAEALRSLQGDAWERSGRLDDAQGWLAAHLLALQPTGQSGRLVQKERVTVYLTRFEEMQAELFSGPLLVR